MTFLTLNFNGALLTLAMGVAFFMIGLDMGYFFVLVMLFFLVLAAIVTMVGANYKKRIGTFQKCRGVHNVLANGLAPLIMAILFYWSTTAGHPTIAMLSVIGFTGSVAAATADKFASELGVFGGMPRLIFTSRKVKRGVSGGVTALGTNASIIGAFLIALTVLIAAQKLVSIGSVYSFNPLFAVVSITVAGLVGNIIDSMLGYYEEKGVGNKSTSNFLCSMVGAVAAVSIYIILI
jgi:uncharacterized protein (TIGR00297 family)